MTETDESPVVPDEVADMDPADAKDRMDELVAQRLQLTADDPRFRKLTREINGLAARVAEDQEGRREVREQEQVAKMQAGGEPGLDARRQAEEDVAKLRALGFVGDELPEGEVKPHVATALRMQRLNAEGKADELVPIMERELTTLHAPASTFEQLRTFANTPDLDADLRATIFDDVIRWIHAANVQRYGKPKAPGTPTTAEANDNTFKTYGHRRK